jgi:GntR family transcriptional regulator, arabinose operon transcriptional repressor
MGETSFRLDLRGRRSGQPKYARLKEHVTNEIIAGRLRPGQALPSEQRLVKQLGVARMTIRQAMIALENDGLIRRVQGQGSFVEADARRKLKRGLDIFALMVPETRGGFYPSLLHSFEAAAGDIHHQTLICNTENDVSRQGDIILQLLDKQVGGVAMVPTSKPLTPAHQVRQLQNRGVPVVFCHRRVEEIAAPLLAIPFDQLGHMTGRVLAERGHRRVAFFNTHRTPSTDIVLEKGLNQELRASGSDTDAESVVIGETSKFREEDVFGALKRVFAKPNPPTAIFTGFDTLAEMIYFLMPRLGLRVPEDVSLLGFGDVCRDGVLTQRLTSIVVDESATGQKAATLLHEMRRGERPIEDDTEIVMPLKLSDGQTLGAPPRSEASA